MWRTARLMAEGCQSAGDNAETVGASALYPSLRLRCLPLTGCGCELCVAHPETKSAVVDCPVVTFVSAIFHSAHNIRGAGEWSRHDDAGSGRQQCVGPRPVHHRAGDAPPVRRASSARTRRRPGLAQHPAWTRTRHSR